MDDSCFSIRDLTHRAVLDWRDSDEGGWERCTGESCPPSLLALSTAPRCRPHPTSLSTSPCCHDGFKLQVGSLGPLISPDLPYFWSSSSQDIRPTAEEEEWGPMAHLQDLGRWIADPLLDTRLC